MGKTHCTFESRESTLCKKKGENNVALEGFVEVGSSNEMRAVVLDQRVCTGRPLLERKNLRRSLGSLCVAYFDFSALLSVTHSKDFNCTDFASV